jgi:hypothetical protein
MDKNRIKKLFKTYDKEKKRSILVTDLEKVIGHIQEDQGLIGKVPCLKQTVEEITMTLGGWSNQEEKEKEERISWDSFITNINSVEWSYQCKEVLQERIR